MGFAATSIGKRFLAASVLFTIALVAAIAFVSIRADSAILRTQMDLRGNSMARYMARTSLFYYRNFDLGALEGFVKDITSDPEVAFAVFYDDKQKPLTNASARPAGADSLLVYDHEVRDEAGSLLGSVSLGYRTAMLDASARQLIQIMAGSAAIAVLIAALGALGIVRRMIVRPLDTAMHAAKRLAEGDLTVRFEAARADEIGRLLAALEGMRVALAGSVGTIRHSADRVGSAATRIAAGNGELSSRTEQQASSLEETASSMEELTATVKLNAENAKQANELAIGASGVAAQGGQVMSQVIETMGDISVASRRIADIIGVIDGISFQTNILALNAAVEAARAGEQGRGFAVVAAEVRSLAQRSAAAAREIKELIQDSVSRVDGGTRLVEGAGRTMDGIVTAVKRVTDIMAEIASASGEQLRGIEQVANAVTQMDRVTQHNASLVEESAAAAENMADQAQQLNRAVARFTLDGVDAPAPEPLPVASPLPATRAAAALASRGHAAERAPAPVPAASRAPARARPARLEPTQGADADWEEF